MRLIDLAVAYLVVGMGCAWALRTRAASAATSLADTVLTFTLWPLYVPALLAPERPSRRIAARARDASPRIERERAMLAEALDAARARMEHPGLAALLPTGEQLATLTEHMIRLDAKVQELDEVLSREDFDVVRAERRLRESNGANAEAATAALEGARKLVSLRERAARERDELLGLCARLRMQVTVLRFSEGHAGDDLGALVSELLGRIEGVGAALEPAVPSRA